MIDACIAWLYFNLFKVEHVGYILKPKFWYMQQCNAPDSRSKGFRFIVLSTYVEVKCRRVSETICKAKLFCSYPLKIKLI